MDRSPSSSPVLRVARGVGAFVLADLVVGLTAFSTISLAALWMFSFGWVRLAGEYHAIGGQFGQPWQLDLAWAGVLVCLPMIGIVLFLGRESLRVPARWFRKAWRPE